MVYHLSMYSADPLQEDDLESLFLLEDEQTPESILIVDYSESEAETKDDEVVCPHIGPEEIHLKEPMFDLSFALQRPYARINIFFEHYSKPIPVITFFNTGAACTFINPSLLLPSHWKPHHQVFRAANGQPSVA